VADSSEISVIAVPSGDETTSHCPCCHRPIYKGAGDLQSTAGTIAVYWYEWPEGHEGRFALAVGRISADGDPVSGVLVVAASVNAEQITYAVLDPENSPWSTFGSFGGPLTRSEALSEDNRGPWFTLVDAIAANERRISSRILSSGLTS
jgi:hypothetical protein